MLDAAPMPLELIHGPPNSGRAGLVRRALIAVLERDPVLVVPTVDDVYSFERELCEKGAVLGASVMTFGGLFRTVATAAGAPPGAELTRAQRLGAVSTAIAESQAELGPLRRSATRPGFPRAFADLLDELQGAGLEPADVEAAAGTLEGSAYLADVAALYSRYAAVRDRLGVVDEFEIAREAIRLLAESGPFWRRPVFLYGLDDLTPNQMDLVGALAGATDVTVALPYEEGNLALAARPALLERLREIGVESDRATEAEPANTASPLLFHLERSFGAADPARMAPDDSLLILRSAGERGEAEAIAGEVARLLAGGSDPGEVAIVLRDPRRRGTLIASVLESYGIPVALEAEVPVASTAAGSGLMAMLETIVGSARSADLLRYLRLAGGVAPGVVDSFERSVRRERVQTAAAAIELWEERFGDPPGDLATARELAARPAELVAAVGRIAARIAAMGSGLEQSAAAAIASALAERSELADLAPPPEGLARVLGELDVRVWRGPAEGRVRIADPYRLRAARFDHVIVGSLQDGEFPRRDGRADPFLSEAQRETLGLEPRRDTDAEERYLFAACLALPRRRLVLSYRDSDENGVAESRSPLLDQVRRLLDPPPGEERPDLVEAALTRGRDLAQVVCRVADAPSEDELARAIAARDGADVASLLAVAGAREEVGRRVAARIERAVEVEAATRAPGPLSNPAVLEALGSVAAYGGTTLEEFDVCSYRWFVGHQLGPEDLDPDPEPLAQGGLMHEALHRLYEERPGGDRQPRSRSLAAWRARGAAIVREIAAERGVGGQPSERAMVRRVEALLARFLGEEAARSGGPFEPWLLEAGFGEEDGRDRPVLELDGWGLHGAIDRVDRAPDGRALVLDYKLSSSVTARKKLEEKAKLQLQLYLIAVAELWDAPTVGGLYHPLRGTSTRSPRGAVLRDAADDLPYRLTGPDLLDEAGYEQLLDDARARAGAIVKRMRSGDIRRDPGPREGLRGHGLCPTHCDFAPICRRDRAFEEPREEDEEEA
jgi:ATP-dependent helicase/DNAse subunit B